MNVTSKTNKLDILQKARSPLFRWALFSIFGIIFIIYMEIRFYLNGDFLISKYSTLFTIFRVLFIGLLIFSIILTGIFIWPYRSYKFFGIQTSYSGSMSFIPIKNESNYWLYKDDQLEVIQAGIPSFYNWPVILCIPPFIISLIPLGVIFYSEFISLISSSLSFFAPLFLLLGIFYVFVVIIAVIAVLRSIRRLFHPPTRGLFITVWMPGCSKIPSFVSLTLNSQAVRISMRRGRSSRKKILLPIDKPIQLYFGTKTVSFSLSYTEPLPQIPSNLLLIVKDWSFFATQAG
ncbi:MAG: hypothetical protein ACFFC7_04780 [Candidatus Hermodarchaeota archaeon]